MEFLLVIGIIVPLIFYIWLVSLFVNLCRKTNEIRDSVSLLVDRELELNEHSVEVDKKDVSLALLNGRTDECYRNIIDNLFSLYYKSCKEDKGDFIVYKGGSDLSITNTVNIYSLYCKRLGKKLPSELESIDNFLNFYNQDIATECR